MSEVRQKIPQRFPGCLAISQTKFQLHQRQREFVLVRNALVWDDADKKLVSEFFKLVTTDEKIDHNCR